MPHHPPHLFLDDTWYMLTASTLGNRPYLRPGANKEFIRDSLKSGIAEFRIKLLAWVLLDNHYHLLFKLPEAGSLPDFIRRFHGRTSFEINRREMSKGRQVWHNYWDTCIRDEAGLWTRFNYIHHNPVKHGYVKDMAEWPYSSYPFYLRRRGPDWLADAFRRYPIIDYSEEPE